MWYVVSNLRICSGKSPWCKTPGHRRIRDDALVSLILETLEASTPKTHPTENATRSLKYKADVNSACAVTRDHDSSPLTRDL